MKSLNDRKEFTVGELYKSWGKELRLNAITGKGGFSRYITSALVLKPEIPGLNNQTDTQAGRIQILGRGELKRFYSLPQEEKEEFASLVPCFITAKGLVPEPSLKNACQKTKTPLFSTGQFTGKLITTLETILEERLSPFTTAHGVLLEVYGVGVLILGESGIGKSESALDLINRGSKLISDDIVEIRKSGSSGLLGKGPTGIRHLMEIRGVGIINIKDLFGKASVMDEREIDMVIELVHWHPDTEYDRLGLDVKTYSILDTEVPYLKIPLSPGRNTATIIEVAARNQRLKKSGIHSAEDFNALHRELTSNRMKK